MDTLVTVVAGFGLLVILSPLLMLLLTGFVLVPLALLAPRVPMIARSSFRCPVTKKSVNASFLTTPGHEHASDVLTCSVFGTGPVRCERACLGVTETTWEPSPMAPRYSLIAGDTVLRDTARV